MSVIHAPAKELGRNLCQDFPTKLSIILAPAEELDDLSAEIFITGEGG